MHCGIAENPAATSAGGTPDPSVGARQSAADPLAKLYAIEEKEIKIEFGEVNSKPVGL
jgi:hypothetical protein